MMRRGDANLSGVSSETEAERVGCARVTYNFLSVLGVPPELGRDFGESDDVPHCKKVALISDALWKRRFGGSRDVIGRYITLDSVQREIIGVLRPNIKVPRAAQVYIPLEDLRSDRDYLNRGNHPGFSALGRLNPDVTLAQATADLNNIATELERRYPDSNTGRRVTALILLDSAVQDYKRAFSFFWLRSAVCFLSPVPMSRIYSSRVRSGVNANWRCALLSAQVVANLPSRFLLKAQFSPCSGPLREFFSPFGGWTRSGQFRRPVPRVSRRLM